MGRKQNPLVVEFFQRGEKLGNSSNRYACTCRRCGEQFPKGRTETLLSHILKKCPNVSLEEQQWVFQRIQQNPERRSGNNEASMNGLLTIARQPGQDDQAGLPQSELHHQSALDTLAEVSRHHLDYSAERTTNDIDRDVNDRALSEMLAEQALLTELRRHADNEPFRDSANSTKSLLNTSRDSPPRVHASEGVPSGEVTTVDASPLVQTASAANHQLELAMASTIPEDPVQSLVDPQLGEARDQDQLSQQRTFQIPNGNKRTWSQKQESEMVSQQQLKELAVRPDKLGPGIGLLQKTISPKKRGRFDDNRRKEVWDIRKRGACIRCRMLKKPCSGETPCSTCSSVESGRLWKGKCVRTRLVEECTLWSMKIFHSRANLNLAGTGPEHGQVSLPGCIEARLFVGSKLYLTFAARAHAHPVHGIDPALHLHPGHEASKSDILLLSNDEEGIAEKVGEYAKRIVDACIEEEPSIFVRATLQLALKLAQANESDKPTKAPHTDGNLSPRSSYNVQDELLQNVVELWILTQLLVPNGPNAFELRYDPVKMPQKEPHEAEWTTNGHEHNGGHIHESSQSWRTIQCQLLAAVESRCSKLYKTVMNELERRLLQRQQVSRFATFLCSVILLNSVERMCGMYSRVDDAEAPFSQSSKGQSNDHSQPTTQPGTSLPSSIRNGQDKAFSNGDASTSWPLDVAPSTLWQQGHQFSDLLVMLLRMRALLPKTKELPDGTLSTAQDFSFSKNSRGQSVKNRIEEQTEAAAVLIDPLGLSVSELVMKRDGDLTQHGEEAWDMRLVSKLLLPEMVA